MKIKECIFEAGGQKCGKKVHAKSLCPAHYAQNLKHGRMKPLVVKSAPEEKFINEILYRKCSNKACKNSWKIFNKENYPDCDGGYSSRQCNECLKKGHKNGGIVEKKKRK